MYTLKSIAGITGARFAGSADRSVSHFLTDSRNLHFAEETMFIALSTQRLDGHQFIADLYANGVRSFLVEEQKCQPADYPEASFLVASSPLAALQELAAHHRRQFNIPVIGITGSNGKTVVKEWLYQCLKPEYRICRSPKSYNSQIGVPLSVLNLNNSHTLAIFEAGISRPGEMEVLERIINPTLGVFTSLGSAHDEGFRDREEKLREKFRLFEHSKKVFVNGLSEKDLTFFKGTFESVPPLPATTVVPYSDQASLENAATCTALMRELGVEEQAIQARLRILQPVALRLELKVAINNSLLINDYYNSDLDSLQIAVNHLQHQSRRQQKVVIVSDIEQSGLAPAELYRQVALLFKKRGIDLVIGIGEGIAEHRGLFPGNALFFSTTGDFVSSFSAIKHQLSNSTILLKGARSFDFEQIGRLLQQKSHDTVFEVNLNKLRDNVNYFRGMLKPPVKLMCMVKAMGYGSGGAEIGRNLENMGVNYLAVAYADEGVELRESNVKLPIMVMSPEEDGFEDIVSFNLEPEIYNFRILRLFGTKLDALGVTDPFPVHIKIDTGMHRLGFDESEMPALISELARFPNMQVRSVFSHLVGSDNDSLDEFTHKQIAVFEKATAALKNGLGYSFLTHICNSGGISRFPGAHYDMVRLGIGMYGVGVNAGEQKKLANVGTLKTRISQIKNIPPGETVGYNRNGKVETVSRVATIPIGYADGFSRLLGNGRHGVYVRGKFVKTIGNICMDMCMIDVSEVDCEEGDEVIIFEDHRQIKDLANALNTITYEVLTSVSARVKRVYLQE